MPKTAALPVANPAKRGDLVVIEDERKYFIIGQGPSNHMEFTVCVVTGIRRDGRVRTVRPVGFDSTVDIERWVGFRCCHLISQLAINVQAALATAATHCWPAREGIPDHPRYYDTLEEVKAALRPHRVGR